MLMVIAGFLCMLYACGEQTKPPAKQQAEASKPAGEQKPAGRARAEEKKALFEDAAYHYDPMGKIDPFLPLVRDIEGLGETMPGGAPLTPLQRYTLAELKLVAVIVAGEDSKAMVEDGKGDGYILSRGTLIGNKHGEVVEINKNEIVVLEKEINPISGGVIQKRVSLVLHKPEEEEL